MTDMLSRLTAAAIFACAGVARAAPQVSILTSFRSQGERVPIGNVVFDKAGNLYGTTAQGGGGGAGTVFKLMPPATDAGAWTRSTIHTFKGADGHAPRGALIMDAAGNLYGTTAIGGASNMGTAYELSPPRPGQPGWRYAQLTSFAADASYPYGGLVFDKAGNLFGTTLGTQSGPNGKWSGSAAFELSPPAGGSATWTRTIIGQLDGAVGYGSEGALAIDGAGNLYGTTQGGAAGGGGAIFELTPPAPGSTDWKTTRLYACTGKNGPFSPLGALIFDASGNLFGTSYGGGTYGFGAVFELSPPDAGHASWTETLLWSFGVGGLGQYPTEGSLIIGKSGELYGTTYYGGAIGVGLVFKLTPPAKRGDWTETVLLSFTGYDGAAPTGYLTADARGALYGTTAAGGRGFGGHTFGYGTVFRLTQ